MPTLRSALKAGDLPPRAHLIHIALTELGEGEYTGLKLGLWMDSDGYYRLIDAAGNASPP